MNRPTAGFLLIRPNGLGSHSLTVVRGADAFRVVCMICGVQTPLRIKGERPHRRLSILLQEISVSVQ